MIFTDTVQGCINFHGTYISMHKVCRESPSLMGTYVTCDTQINMFLAPDNKAPGHPPLNPGD